MPGARSPIGNYRSALESYFTPGGWQLISTQMDQWTVPERTCAYVKFVGSKHRRMQFKRRVKRLVWVSSTCGLLVERVYLI